MPLKMKEAATKQTKTKFAKQTNEKGKTKETGSFT